MTVARYLCLLIPLVAWAVAARVNRERAGALLALLAAAVGIAALQEVATAAGWYGFAPVDGAYRGMPVDLWLGWAALWGPIPVLLRRTVPLPVMLGLLLWADVTAMPALEPLVVLGPDWLLGEAVGLLAVALPAQLLGRWTACRTRLIPRVLLQMTVFSGLVLWLVPTVAFTLGDGGWDRLWSLPGEARLLLLQIAVAVAVPALAAVREFATRGDGTPFPWDPPSRLVTTGPYAYLANPMQVSTVLLVMLLAAATRSATLAVVALNVTAFSIALAGPHERRDMAVRHGASWREYRRHVRDWWPRGTPYRGRTVARLWLDTDCGPCATVRDVLLRGEPRDLTVHAAADFPGTLWRARYESDDGHVADGVGAVARAMEHTGLLWAYTGWVLLLPGLRPLAQLVVDALIAAPHSVGQNERP